MQTFAERYLNRHMAMELAPVLVLFVVNKFWGLMAATAAVIVVALLVTLWRWLTERKLPYLALITLALTLGLGGASLILADGDFIKMKATVGKLLFALILAGGLALTPSLTERALAAFKLQLDPTGWRVITLGWIAIALVFAGLNEFVWRNYDTDSWATFTLAATPISILGYILTVRLTAARFWRDETST